MIEIIKEHWILSVIGTIILGALGSGLWETAFKPTFQYLGKISYTIITLGAKRASDNIYKEAARGHHELPGLYAVVIIIFIAVGLIATIQTSLVASFYIDDDLIGFTECNEIADSDEKRECLKENKHEYMSTILPYHTLLGIFICVILIYRIIAINRVNLTITYYKQCLKICSLYMTTDEIILTEHMYSLMKERSTYLEIIDSFKNIAEKNDIVLPKAYI